MLFLSCIIIIIIVLHHAVFNSFNIYNLMKHFKVTFQDSKKDIETKLKNIL